jgi:hypothetical protein
VRLVSFAFLTILPSLVWAGEGFAGTKTGMAASSASAAPSPVGPAAIFQMILALAIVLGLLKVVLPKLAGRINKKLATTLDSDLRIEESASFAGGTLYIVQARRKSLLLSVSPSGVSCLADLTEGPQLPPDPPTFRELVEEAPGDALPSHAVIEEIEAHEEDALPIATAAEDAPEEGTSAAAPSIPSPDQIAAALERLRRLSG